MRLRVGLDAQWVLPRGGAGTTLRDFAVRADESGLDHLGVGDHVSFNDGQGFDGLINSMALLASAPRIAVRLQVYLLPLRHPVLVARQLSTLAEHAPGRLELAVGIGGEDRDEYAVSGLDAAHRGARANECLEVLRALATGEAVDYDGDHVTLRGARVLPAPDPRIPLIIGGRSDAAYRRVGRLGDGWQAVWLSTGRFAEACATIDEHARAAGRESVDWDHGMTFWAGFDHDGVPGRDRVAGVMEPFYQAPFEKFARYVPTGTPEQVAEAIAPYVEAGCQSVTVVGAGLEPADAVDKAAQVRGLLLGG